MMETQIPHDVEERFNEIGQALVNILPQDFVDSWVHMQWLADNVWGIEIFFKKPNGHFGAPNADISKLLEAFKKLHNSYAEESPQAWTEATFNLTNKFKMHTHFGYEPQTADVIKELDDRKKWKRENLGADAIIDGD
jgi:hypothetical protein